MLTDNLTLRLGRAPVVFHGWTAFDGRMEYQLAGKGKDLTDRIPSQLKELMEEWSVDVDRLVSIKIKGTVDSPAVEVGGELIDMDLPRNGNRRKRIQEIGGKLRDQLLR